MCTSILDANPAVKEGESSSPSKSKTKFNSQQGFRPKVKRQVLFEVMCLVILPIQIHNFWPIGFDIFHVQRD